MAVPACLRLADNVFPSARALAAHRLRDEGWNQTRTAQALGISQAMVSKLLAAAQPTDPLARHLAADLVAELVNPAPAQGPSTWCATLSLGHDRPGGAVAVNDLLAAESLLLANPPLAIMPQVGLNLARALPDAATPQDILAFPGRLVEAGGRIVRPAAPTFGGSNHLAGLLLARPGPLSNANVRGGSKMVQAAKRLNWTVQVFERTGRASDEAALLKAVAKLPIHAALHDPGAVGIESCLYIFGADATSVAQSILQLNQTLVNP